MKRLLKLSAMLTVLSIVSACGGPERPATASDTARTNLCLIDKAISFDPAPAAGVDDAGNKFDTDQTVDEILEHNARLNAVCAAPE